MLEMILSHVEVFTLVLVRIGGFFLASPFLGARNIPMQVKAGLVVFLAILVTPVIAATDAGALYAGKPFAELFLVLLKELMVGIALGLIATSVFAAIQVGGMFVDMQIGFAMANVFDPSTGTSSPLTGQFKNMLAMLLFLGFDGHHGLFTALLQSYGFVPIGSFEVTDRLAAVFIQTLSVMFVLGLKIALPIMAALFLTDVGLAILARSVPQMNVFAVGMPLKLIVGLGMMVVVMPAFVYMLRGLFNTMFTQMDILLRVLGG